MQTIWDFISCRYISKWIHRSGPPFKWPPRNYLYHIVLIVWFLGIYTASLSSVILPFYIHSSSMHCISLHLSYQFLSILLRDRQVNWKAAILSMCKAHWICFFGSLFLLAVWVRAVSLGWSLDNSRQAMAMLTLLLRTLHGSINRSSSNTA